MLMCGKLDYSKFQPYHELNCDFANDTSDISVSEIKFIKTDSGDIVALFAAETIQGLYKSDEHTKDKLYYLVFHKGKYQTYSAAAKAKVDIEPTPFEVLIHEYFDSEDGKEVLSSGVVRKGTFSIHAGASIHTQIRKLQAWDVIFSLPDIVDEPVLLVEAKESAARGKGGYGGQKEGEKLKERMAFVLEQFALTDCKTLQDAAVVLKSESLFPKVTQEDLTLRLIELCIK